MWETNRKERELRRKEEEEHHEWQMMTRNQKIEKMKQEEEEEQKRIKNQMTAKEKKERRLQEVKTLRKNWTSWRETEGENEEEDEGRETIPSKYENLRPDEVEGSKPVNSNSPAEADFSPEKIGGRTGGVGGANYETTLTIPPSLWRSNAHYNAGPIAEVEGEKGVEKWMRLNSSLPNAWKSFLS